jgi:hypothetical protein
MPSCVRQQFESTSEPVCPPCHEKEKNETTITKAKRVSRILWVEKKWVLQNAAIRRGGGGGGGGSGTDRDIMQCLCRGAYYCDRRCQKGHWQEHKHTCTYYLDCEKSKK